MKARRLRSEIPFLFTAGLSYPVYVVPETATFYLYSHEFDTILNSVTINTLDGKEIVKQLKHAEIEADLLRDQLVLKNQLRDQFERMSDDNEIIEIEEETD